MNDPPVECKNAVKLYYTGINLRFSFSVTLNFDAVV